ncbi:unnamed protein product [Polarella glacialis]|uniref:Uncharacterized protein n=1 Tax=Polarella glacialis TaxID=89957 RepID=A0A813LR13_POLGL|nr:unnamed protein product [Polarella glacialis]
MCGSLLAPTGYLASKDNVVSLQMSPDYIGSPFYPDNNTVSYQPQSGRFGEALENQIVGGGFVESFAFGGQSPGTSGQRGGSNVSMFAPREAFSLSKEELARPSEGEPWSSFLLGDGGNIDNSGLLVISTGREIPKDVNLCNLTVVDSSLAKQLENQLRAAFGHWQEDDLGEFLSQNQVFKKEDLQPNDSQYAQSTNDWWGICGGFEAKIIFIYLDKCADFVQKLPEETAQELQLSFPHYLPAFQNLGEATGLSTEQVCFWGILCTPECSIDDGFAAGFRLQQTKLEAGGVAFAAVVVPALEQVGKLLVAIVVASHLVNFTLGQATSFCNPKLLKCTGTTTTLDRSSNIFDSIDVAWVAKPIAVDWDGDGDIDLLFGNPYGRIQFFERTADASLVERTGSSNPFDGINVALCKCIAHRTHWQLQPFDGIDLGYHAAPVAVDWDGDGDIDLLASNSDGRIQFFERTTNASLIERTGSSNPFDGIDVGRNAAPFAVDWDEDGDIDLLVGHSLGLMQFFERTADAKLIDRTGSSNPFVGIDIGRNAQPFAVDWDGDGDIDLLVGNDWGHIRIEHLAMIQFFERSADASLIEQTGYSNPFVAVVVPNCFGSSTSDRDGDGVIDLLSDRWAARTVLGRIQLFERSADAALIERTGSSNPFDGIDVGYASQSAADWDGDGDIDLLVGNSDGRVQFFERTANASLIERTGSSNPCDSIDVGRNAAPFAVDWDEDGDIDLLAGNSVGRIQFFERSADASLVERTGSSNPFVGIDVGWNAQPFAVDWDGDGDIDLLAGNSDGRIQFFERSADVSLIERTGSSNPFDGIDVGRNAAPFAVDWDGDGDIDLLAGNSDGRILFFSSGFCEVLDPCSRNSICPAAAEGACVCLVGYDGAHCSVCSGGYYSEDLSCVPCPGLRSAEGTCSGCGLCLDDDEARSQAKTQHAPNASIAAAHGDGTCACSSGFFGSRCDEGQCGNGLFLAINFTIGIKECQPCPGGSGKPWPGNDLICQPCGPGSFAPGTGSGGICSLCSPGRFSDSYGLLGCSDCPSGTSTPGNATNCSICRAGMWSGAGSRNCSDCPAGRAAALSGSAQCDDCPEGKFALSGSGQRLEILDDLWSPEGSASVHVVLDPSVLSVAGPSVESCSEGDFQSSDLVHIMSIGIAEHWFIKPSDITPDPTSILGSGGFGIVVKGMLNHATEVAIKIPKTRFQKREESQLANEMRLFRHIRHSNIVLFHGATLMIINGGSPCLSLVLEWVNGGNFGDYMQQLRSNAVFEADGRAFAYKILLDVARGMTYLHKLTPIILHLDLKPANILVEKSVPPKGKITDFGLSRFARSSLPQHKVGTEKYMAPEVAQGKSYGPAADVFSFGRVIIWTITGELCPERISSTSTEGHEDFQIGVKEEASIFQTLDDLASSCLEENGEKAMEIVQRLGHQDLHYILSQRADCPEGRAAALSGSGQCTRAHLGNMLIVRGVSNAKHAKLELLPLLRGAAFARPALPAGKVQYQFRPWWREGATFRTMPSERSCQARSRRSSLRTRRRREVDSRCWTGTLRSLLRRQRRPRQRFARVGRGVAKLKYLHGNPECYCSHL